MARFKGIIALDIDGTLTVDAHHLEKKVSDYLNFLIQEGWKLIFLTGRTFSFAKPLLLGLHGTYYFAVQNGAALFEMPSERCVEKHYLPSRLLLKLEKVFLKEPEGLLVESGKECEDICYYCPESFAAKELEYVHFRIHISPGNWIAVSAFADLPFSEFAVGKYFSSEEKAYALAEKIHQIATVNIIVIRDLFNPGQYLAHINNKEASKGRVLKRFCQTYAEDLPIIAAGDDLNDVEMLENSTFKIVMRNAPHSMHALADLVAPPVQENGIIHALEEAIRVHGRNH